MENILKKLKRELKRSYAKLKLEDNPSPYFISYLYRKINNINIWGKYGDLFENSNSTDCVAYVEVRIGDHSFDNTIHGGLYGNSTKEDSFSWVAAPEKYKHDALIHTLWRLTDLKYKEALIDYYQKKSHMIKEILVYKAPLDFSYEEPSVNRKKPDKIKFPLKEWKRIVEKYSKKFKYHKDIYNSYISIIARNTHKYYVNTEGSEISQSEIFYGIKIAAQSLAKDGMFLEKSWSDMYSDLSDFPDEEKIDSKIEEIIDDLKKLMVAEVLKPYSGPAILYPSAAGIFFHEAIGHRLEGERLLSPGEGQTFKGKSGCNILPEFISIYDDPTIKKFNGKSLIGHYMYDDEGIPAQKVDLIKDGVLKNFLLSRSVADNFTNSNGHGRAVFHEDPIARMANLIVKSSLEYDDHKLREMLIEETEKQGNEFGLIIKEARSGETNTNRYNFQAFKGQPTMVYKIDPISGKETLVRGTEFIGTPLTSVQKVMATGKIYEVTSGFCGAESGLIPVSTISPSILIKEVEMQRGNEPNLQPPILMSPWYKKKRS